MRHTTRRKWKLTEGERARVLAFVLVGLSSAALGYLAVLHLDRSALFNELSASQTWIIVAAAIGGLLALFLSGDRIGQTGRNGLLRSAAGGIWVTFVGALIGGTLGLPLYGTMFGPFVVAVTLLGAPILAVFWVLNLVGIHFLLAVHQRERDSIFDYAKADQPQRPKMPLNNSTF